ncbi:MAG TPA: type 1 glutamine amidotransferase [Bryobacteraceae bacterium]|jgi:GMP synthase (glutamine-hydrolysing)|nr:type 1 glutamine amidotransferase [Bryobacteraceae bacterium]
MQVLVLRHEPFEHLGHFGEVLEENHVSYRYHELGEPFVEEQHDGLIIMGGPMSANDDLPGLRDELGRIEKALHDDLPMLGICLGSQLIARALGARVYRNRELEIGWEAVWFTEAARDDALFGGMASPETFFHWHGETFDLPAGAEWLAYSEKCKHQAYRYGSHVYGIQFHPEITAEMIADWCVQPVNCGDVEAVGVIDPVAYDTRERARRIVEGWVGCFAGLGRAGREPAPLG